MKNNSRKPKQVDQFTFEKVFIKRFNSINEAERETEVNGTSISLCCKGKHKQAGGYIWKYAKEDKSPENNELGNLYDEIKAVVKKYCILKEGYSDVITLWILGCYFISEINPFPRLVITAPTRSCGKSQVLKVIKALTLDSRITIKPTAAAIYRLDKNTFPVRLIDEVDEWLKNEKEAYDILNAGFEKGNVIERIDPNTNMPKEHNPFMPIAMAGIQIESLLNQTTLSRSITLHIQKKKGGEFADISQIQKEYEPLRDKTLGLVESLKNLYSPGTPPEHSDDRIKQVWSALYGIADMAGKLPEVNKSFEIINDNYEEKDIGILLLMLVKKYMDHSDIEKKTLNKSGKEYIRTKKLYNLISSDEEFIENNINVNQNTFTTMIKGFGVESKKVKFGTSSSAVSALNITDLKSVFAHYLN